jgi:hypothetical protein
MGKDGGGRAGLESNELKAKRSGPVCILTLLNQYVKLFLVHFQKEEKKRRKFPNGPVPKHFGQLRLLNCRKSLVVKYSQHHLISSHHPGQGAVSVSHLILITEDQDIRQRISSHLDHIGSKQETAHRSVSRSQRRLSRYVGRRSEGCSRSQKRLEASP